MNEDILVNNDVQKDNQRGITSNKEKNKSQNLSYDAISQDLQDSCLKCSDRHSLPNFSKKKVKTRMQKGSETQ